jgi:cell division septation protein DedD
MIWSDNIKKRVKRSLAVTCAALLTISAPLFSSTDYNMLIRSTSSMPTANGLKMLDSLSRVKGAGGAQALRLLGDHAFIKEDYKKAAAFYSEASQIHNLSVYRHLHALAAALDGQTAAAADIWNTIAEDLSNELNINAALHLAYLEMQKLNWSEAYSILQSAAPADTASPLYIPFVWEMLECSREMKRNDRVSFHEKQLAAFKGHIIESGGIAVFQPPVSANSQSSNTAVNTANLNAEKSPTAIETNKDNHKKIDAEKNVSVNKKEVSSQNQQNANFTIQVGAFGSKDNAENIVKKLSENYSDIIILPPAIGGPVLYRVRVGSFVKREEAEAAAQKLLAAGMSPRVVEK